MRFSRHCDGIVRRDFVRVGGLSSLGLGLGSFFQARASLASEGKATTDSKAKSCILIWLDGGPSHIETFDPKPDAPEEVRGPLSAIQTNVSGVRINECMTQTAKIMDKIAVVRSVTSPLGEHNFGSHYLMTGYRPTPALQYPMIGSTLAAMQSSQSTMPPNIAIPRLTGKHPSNGFLPIGTQPFSVGGNPDQSGFKVRDLDFYQGLDLQRLDRRREFVRALDEFSSAKDANRPATSDPNLERAYNLIASQDAKQAFDLSSEPPSVRNRYGRGGNGLGQGCLLARRLIQRGVRFVTVNSTGWDTHQNILNLKERYPGDRNAHLPSLDRALNALLMDLSDSGMLDETLVMVMGEFGRTPKINTNGGRDHWPKVFSVVLAGGGIQGGQVYGASDPLGEFPRDKPVTPSDLAATIYTLLGIDPTAELRTPDGRPIKIAPDGAKVISDLLS